MLPMYSRKTLKDPRRTLHVSGEVKRVDDVEQLLVLEGYPIPFGNIHALTVQGMEGADSA